jgi:hypothetical protein
MGPKFTTFSLNVQALAQKHIQTTVSQIVFHCTNDRNTINVKQTILGKQQISKA